jgi:D-alanyl-D-alanine carboxypeptidase
MPDGSTGSSLDFRHAVTSLVVALVALSLVSEAADARSRKRTKVAPTAATTEARYADIVVDANTGDVLHAVKPDAPRRPASLTKIMTLYLLFERLEAGKIKLNTPLAVSENASAQPPSKLGLRPSQTIEVEDAIKALVTKSANDIAVVIAEALGGSEEQFAEMMTRKARALGMSRTTYKNASGLPDDDQVTTARDQALLGLAIQERFPRYYRYFSTRSFAFRGHSMRNHNKLLGTVEGVDGIKTGYTHASGFNLITSVRRGPRHIVAAVFGGETGAQRDARMRQLIEAHVKEASGKPASKVAEMPKPADRGESKKVASAADAAPTKLELASAKTEPASAPDGVTAFAPTPPPGSTDPIKPNAVKTVSVKAGIDSAPLMTIAPEEITPAAGSSPGAPLPPPPPGARPGILGVLPAKMIETPKPADRPGVSELSQASGNPAPAAVPIATASIAAPRTNHAGGWLIQVGAYEDEKEARQYLASAREKAAKLLARAEAYTEPVIVKGDKTLYRARFAGLEKDKAEAACRYLKRKDFVCMEIKN